MAVVVSTLWFPNLGGPAKTNILRSQDGRIELELPAGWGQPLIPNPTCQMSAANQLLFERVCVISQEKKGFTDLARYGGIIRKSMLDRLGEAESTGGEMVQVNGRSALRYEIAGTGRLGMGVGYVITIVETETRFNQVVGYVFRAQLPLSRTHLASLASGLREVTAPPGR